MPESPASVVAAVSGDDDPSGPVESLPDVLPPSVSG
jgi:hypothetical protein